MNDAPIGIFDSGVGGLTVARAIIDQLPNESIIYVGDTANSPYGPKSIEERVIAIELQGAFDHNALQGFKDDLDSHIKIGLDLRREVLGSRATVADAMATIETKFLTMEGQLESKIASIDGRLPMDGKVVKETFSSIAGELEALQNK